MRTYICRKEMDCYLVYDYKLDKLMKYSNLQEVKEIHGENDLTIIENHPTENAFYFPLKLFLDISNHCNLRCIHCLSESSPLKKVNLNENQILRLVDECYKHGVFQIKIGGGEPLLYPNFWDLIRKIRLVAPNIRLSFTTNGTILNEEDAINIKKFECDVSISLDGTEKIHNFIRRSEIFNKVLCSIDILTKHDIFPTIRYTLMDINLNDVLPIYDYCIKNGLKIKVRRYKPTAIMEKYLLTYNKEYYSLVNILAGLESCDIEDIMKNNQDTEKIFYCSHDCGAGFRSIYIDYNGNISPCVFLGENYIIGNIKHENIKEIWDNSKILNNIRGAGENIQCKNCLRKNICHGECMGIKLYYNNNIAGIDPGCCMRETNI